jgi:4-hydroxy-tetrahydrodipicolinate synthase
MSEKFSGTGVAIITPFTKSGAIDYEALGNLIEHIVVNKVDFIVSLGTTSEAATLSSNEKNRVMKCVIENTEKRVPIVMGIGGNNTAEVAETIRKTSFEGIDGILSVAPYYNKPNQEGMLAHFREISKASPIPIILYNVPSRTSSNISSDTVLRLSEECWNVVAVKEASGDLDQISRIIKDKPDEFKVLSGDDALTLPMMALGADGVISVVANAFPAACSAMVRLLHKHKMNEARSIHFSLTEIIDGLFADGNPAGIKAALEILGVCENNLRLPLVPVRGELYQKLEKLINNYETPL